MKVKISVFENSSVDYQELRHIICDKLCRMTSANFFRNDGNEFRFGSNSNLSKHTKLIALIILWMAAYDKTSFRDSFWVRLGEDQAIIVKDGALLIFDDFLNKILNQGEVEKIEVSII